MEHRPANSRRGAPGTHGQAEYSDHGGIAADRIGNIFDAVVGEAVELLCLDRNSGDTRVRRSRIRRRLSQAGETTQSGSDWTSKDNFPVGDCLWSLAHA